MPMGLPSASDVVEVGGRLRLGDRFELEVDAIYERVFELPGD